MASDSPQRGALASQINVTPLVDVMLVLLIIFMVTAPIIQQGVEVNLPKVKAQALPGKEEQFIVSITRNRDVYLNDTICEFVTGWENKTVSHFKPFKLSRLRSPRGRRAGWPSP